MANIKVTEKLASIIKEERLKHDISARQLSDRIGKSVSYVSSLERGKIDYIDEVVFNNIFRVILNTSEKEFNEYMNNLLTDVSIEFSSEKELEKQKWMMQFNLIIRQVPITNDIIEYIDSKLKELNKTSGDLTRKINENAYLEDAELKDNELNIFITDDTTGWSYKFKIEEKFITDILEHKTTKINYIGMMGIIYNLFLFEGYDNNKAITATRDFLKEHLFYTLNQILKSRRKSLLKKIAETSGDTLKDDEFNYSIDLELPEHEVDFDKNFDQLQKFIWKLRDKDIEYTLKSLKTLNKNMAFDYKFMLALLQLPVFTLANLKIKERQDFLNNVAKLLKKTLDDSKEQTPKE